MASQACIPTAYLWTVRTHTSRSNTGYVPSGHIMVRTLFSIQSKPSLSTRMGMATSMEGGTLSAHDLFQVSSYPRQSWAEINVFHQGTPWISKAHTRSAIPTTHHGPDGLRAAKKPTCYVLSNIHISTLIASRGARGCRASRGRRPVRVEHTRQSSLL